MSDVLQDLLPGERLYQQFDVRIAWSQPIGDHTDLAPWQTRDLPPGRMRNSLQTRKMFRENVTLEQAEQWAEDYGREYLRQNAERLPDVSDMTVRVAYDQSEVWSVTWFSHFTFDVGLSDADVMQSFRRFVDRMELRNYHADRDVYCLMGAEDSWRWHARRPDGSNGPAPCRCEHCKKAGIIRIDH